MFLPEYTKETGTTLVLELALNPKSPALQNHTEPVQVWSSGEPSQWVENHLMQQLS